MDAILNSTPGLAPPAGVVPNFVNPPTPAGIPLFAALVVMVVFATMIFWARVLTRLYIMREFKLEDYLLVLGWCFFVTYVGFILAEYPDIMGRHQWDVTLASMMGFAKKVNYAEMFYCFCMLFTKLAILVQIQHIFMPVGTRGSSYWLAVLLMLIGPGYYIAAAIVEIAQCIPREKISNPFVPGFCINNDVNVIFAGAFNLGYDILLFALPIYCILHLQLALRRKLGVCAIFAIGLLGVLSSLLRLYYSIILFSVADLTYNNIGLAWSASLEGCAGILVASFPTMPRLYQFLRGREWGSNGRWSAQTPQLEAEQKRPGGKKRFLWSSGSGVLSSMSADGDVNVETSSANKSKETVEWPLKSVPKVVVEEWEGR